MGHGFQFADHVPSRGLARLAEDGKTCNCTGASGSTGPGVDKLWELNHFPSDKPLCSLWFVYVCCILCGIVLANITVSFRFFSLSMSNVQPLVNKHAVLEALLVS